MTIMIHVTHNYTTKKFDTEEKAMEYIKTEMDKEGLSYQSVYDHTENDIRVIVFQYYTLYMEAFIVHKEFDIRK